MQLPMRIEYDRTFIIIPCTLREFSLHVSTFISTNVINLDGRTTYAIKYDIYVIYVSPLHTVYYALSNGRNTHRHDQRLHRNRVEVEWESVQLQAQKTGTGTKGTPTNSCDDFCDEKTLSPIRTMLMRESFPL